MYMSIMGKYEQIIPNRLPRTSSCRSTGMIIPANYITSLSSPNFELSEEFHHRPIFRRGSASIVMAYRRIKKTSGGVFNFLQSILSIFTFPSILPKRRWFTIPTQLSITPSLGRKFTGTLFGHRHGNVTFVVQSNSRSEPVLLIEFPISTATLVKEMSSGLLKIALECEKLSPLIRRKAAEKLFEEPVWTMYCNSKQCGYAQSRTCTKSDWLVLSTVQSVSIGAGMIPVVDDGRKGGASEAELLYMRARFERFVGNRDSEAFYMLNPDGNGGRDFSIVLLRI